MEDRAFLISGLLPRFAAMWLIDASMEGEPGSKKRMIAIDEATKKCRLLFPERFRPEESTPAKKA